MAETVPFREPIIAGQAVLNKNQKLDLENIIENSTEFLAGEHAKVLEGVLCHIDKKIDEEGFMKASPTYTWYSAAWFRDSSMTSISMTDTARFVSKYMPDRIDLYETARGSSTRLIKFMWSVVGAKMQNLEMGLATDIRDENFKKLRNHIPARYGKDRGYFSVEELHHTDDTEDSKDSWLRQYDSLPLLLLATERHLKEFGKAGIEQQLEFLKTNATKFIRYMIKTYKSPCSNAWEIENTKLHSYDVAAIAAGINSAINIAKATDAELDETAIREEIEKSYPGGPQAFMKQLFIRDGVLYRAKEEKAVDVNGKIIFASEPLKEVESGQIFIFSLFGHDTGETIENNTIRKLEEDMFRLDKEEQYRLIPKRFKNDTYFGGAPWPLLGAEFAYYYAKRGELEKSGKIIKYIEDNLLSKNDFSIPEQESIDAALLNPDPDNLLKNNGGKPIQDLIWSGAEYLRALTAHAEALALRLQVQK